MRFSSQEIKQQTFKKKMRGLDPEEVEVFIHMVADDFEEIEKENKALKNKIRDCKLEIEALQKSEEKLKKTLTEKQTNVTSSQEAEIKGREIILHAKRKAEALKETAMNEAMCIEREISKLRGLKRQLEKEAG